MSGADCGFEQVGLQAAGDSRSPKLSSITYRFFKSLSACGLEYFCPDAQKVVHAEGPFKRQCHSSGHGSSHLAVAETLVCLNLSSLSHPASSL